jgi:poly(hydroxyalkanoate) depolymerase family esterase
MRLSKTISQLNKARKAVAAFTPPSAAGSSRLSELNGVRDNPGNLRGLYYVPEGLKASAPLVVVLHGCTQNASGYDSGSGWSRLADRHGFALLFPEQQRSNNPNLCFNWYQDGDTQRGMGEAASIRSMVDAMRAAHGIDTKRVFVTGLSAGGAMASVMLAAYPDVFAGGAIIAGLPYGCASNLGEAFECMGGRARIDGTDLAASVRAASSHKGPWPRISVWQGSADHLVVPSNAEAIVSQWTEVHGLPSKPSRTETVEGYPRRVWTGADGTELIEQFTITGMAHGTPLMPGTGEGESGEAGAHMLDANISSTDRIAAFFGIAPVPAAQTEKPARKEEPGATAAFGEWTGQASAGGPQKVIEDALKAAGLLR